MQVKSYKSGSLGVVEIDEAPFGDKVLYRTLKDAVTMHQANQRQGTTNARGRSEVRGTNKKPYRQKHTATAPLVMDSAVSAYKFLWMPMKS